MNYIDFCKYKDHWLTDALTKQMYDIDWDISNCISSITFEAAQEKFIITDMKELRELVNGVAMDELPNIRSRLSGLDDLLGAAVAMSEHEKEKLESMKHDRVKLLEKMVGMGYVEERIRPGNGDSYKFFILPKNKELPAIEKDGSREHCNPPNPEKGINCSDTHFKNDSRWYEFWKW